MSQQPNAAPAITRKALLTALFPTTVSIERVEIKEIELAPGQRAGLHRHPYNVGGTSPAALSCSRSRANPIAAVLTVVLVASYPTPGDATPPVYTPEEIQALVKRPESDADLLKNMKVAWDRKLLTQQAFWSNETLRHYLDAESVKWQPPYSNGPPDFPPAVEFVRYRGFGSANSTLLPSAVSVIRYFQRDPPGPVSQGNPHPGHEESGGSIQIAFEHGIAWSVAQELFGTDYINRGPPPPPLIEDWPGQHVIVKSLKPVTEKTPEPTIPEPQAVTSAEEFSVCYLAPQGMPYHPFTNVNDWEGDQICFYLKAGSRPLTWRDDNMVRDPENDDVLINVYLSQNVGHIPTPCYQVRHDPSWEPWCPPGSSGVVAP